MAMWLDYDGTEYLGFGRQRTARTIQGTLESGLAQALGSPVPVIGAARTDAGVHARGQVVSFQMESRLEAEALQRAVNARLPGDIVVTSCRDMPAGFDARRRAVRRSYRYSVWNYPLPCVWNRRYAHHVPKPLDLDAMRQASSHLLGRRDLASFVSEAGGAASAPKAVRSISRAEWSTSESMMTFDICADGFARHMVRGIVGTLLQVGRRQRDAADIAAIIDGRDRRLAGPNAPAHGLSLMGVEYEERWGTRA
jgi:tRNA pseudouridine38-40 synthase